MATKQQLLDTINANAAILGIEVEVNNDMTHDELSALSKDITAKLKDAENETAADKAEEVVEAEEVTHRVGPKVLVCKDKRMLEPGQPITPKDLVGGKDKFDYLVSKGLIVSA